MDNTERLVKVLSGGSALSRRAAGDAVKAGRVAVNGSVVMEPGLQINGTDTVTLDGQTVLRSGKKYYIMLNKPRGYVSSNADAHAEKLAVELIQPAPPVRLFSAGRLDKESEGMLLFSNDGEYVATLTHPRNEILKTYHILLKRELLPEEIRRLLSGITDDGELLRAIVLAPIGKCRYRIVLNEGRKREIRRMTAAAGAPTLRLKRVRTGNLNLGDLPPGHWRELSAAEVAASLVPGLPED